MDMKLNKKQSGQGMTEYILIVALIAVAVIAAVKIFGSSVSTGFSNASSQISGNTSNNAAGSAANAVGSAANVVNSVTGK